MAKENEQHIPSQTDPTVGLFRNMLLVLCFQNVVKKERYEMSTRNSIL